MSKLPGPPILPLAIHSVQMTGTLDIKAKAPYPAGALSNFAPHAFRFDGILCASMEGFLQSLKIEDRAEQERVCGLVGPMAQSVGRTYDWSATGTLWWKGVGPFSTLPVGLGCGPGAFPRSQLEKTKSSTIKAGKAASRPTSQSPRTTHYSANLPSKTSALYCGAVKVGMRRSLIAAGSAAIIVRDCLPRATKARITGLARSAEVSLSS